MATKVFEHDLWIARDKNNSLWSFLEEPAKSKEEGIYYCKNDEFTKNDMPFISCLHNRNLTDIQKELNLTNINEPYKIKVKLIFEDLPDIDKAGLPYRSEMLQKAAYAVYEHTDCLLVTKSEISELKARIRDLEQIKEAYFDLKTELKLALKDIEIE